MNKSIVVSAYNRLIGTNTEDGTYVQKTADHLGISVNDVHRFLEEPEDDDGPTSEDIQAAERRFGCGY